MIAWDRWRIAASAVAGISLIVHLLLSMDAEAVVSHAVFLVLPLSVIFWPEYCERMFRLSNEGRINSSEGMAPEIMIQLVGWILLIVGCSLPLFGPFAV